MKKLILSTPKVLCQSILLAILLSSVAHANTEVAKVNDKVITLEEVNALAARTSFTRKEALDDLVKHEAAVQEAKKLNLDQDPTVIERINNVLYYALLEKKLGNDFSKITLSDSEAKSWYEKNPEIRTSQIIINLPQHASDADEEKVSEKISQILKEVKSGKISFAEAAQKYSEDPSAAAGGDLDYRMKDRLDPTYYKNAAKISKAGDIIGPVRTPYGLHLIRLTGKHSWIEVDRAHVKRLILDERRQEIVTRYLNDLRQKAKVSVNDKLLKE